jgi:1-deoxy-D-xylulose-5-phosphate synthase
VVLCLDRAGLVGEDGPTHHGVFDMAYLRHIPNLTFMAPSTPSELKAMLELAVTLGGPVAIRYPRGSVPADRPPKTPIETGKAEVLKDGKDAAIIAAGCMAEIALEASKLLSNKKIDAMVVNARFIKPLDETLFTGIFRDIKKIVTIEDGVLDGGFGSAILEMIERHGVKGVKVRRMGLPDKFVEHGSRSQLFSKYNLTPQAVCDVIIREMI